MFKRLMAAALLLIGFTIGAGGVAGAHYVYDKGPVWENGERCINVRSEISHGSGSGYVKANVEYLAPNTIGVQVNCALQWQRTRDFAAVNNQVDVWTGSAWAYCIALPYKYNTGGTVSTMVQDRTFASTPCGNGRYYNNWGGGFTYFDGSWKGGQHSTRSYHYLPS